MSPIKVLIIDPNILVRRAITNVLREYGDFNIFWLAEEFDKVEATIKQQHPDVVLLGVDSMESKGLTILSRLRSRFPDLPVLVISPRTDEGAEAVITALRIGAIDFISKPEHENLILFAEGHLQKRLAPLVKAAKRIREGFNINQEMIESLVQPQTSFDQLGSDCLPKTTAEMVVIGGCTGGTQALFSLVSELPANTPAPIIIVQHLPQIYTKFLASKLDSISKLSVREVQNDIIPEKGEIWIAPGGYQCEVIKNGYRNQLNIHRGIRENTMRPSIDILFRSAAHAYRQKTLGVLLSGCGHDGIAGIEEIRKQGGQVIVQDPRTAIAPELPLLAIRNGYTRDYFSPKELAAEIVRRSTDIKTESEPNDTELEDQTVLKM